MSFFSFFPLSGSPTLQVCGLGRHADKYNSVVLGFATSAAKKQTATVTTGTKAVVRDTTTLTTNSSNTTIIMTR